MELIKEWNDSDFVKHGKSHNKFAVNILRLSCFKKFIKVLNEELNAEEIIHLNSRGKNWGI